MKLTNASKQNNFTLNTKLSGVVCLGMVVALNFFQNVLSKIKGGSIHLLACILVMLLAGPEIILLMELSSLMEVIGASTFL